MIPTGTKVVIVGAGIVGSACAARLAAEGFNVTILESATIGGGATAAGMGHVVVMDDSEAQFALTSYSRKLWMELKPSLPKSAEYVSTGTLWVAADSEEMAEVDRKKAFYTQRGVAVEVLDEKSLYQAEPNLRPGLAGALLVNEDGVVYPPVVAAALLDQARRHGATLRIGVTVHSIQAKSVTLATGETLHCDIAVNAAGVRATELTPGLPIRPRKGHLAITDRYPNFVRHQLVELGYLKSAHSVSSDSVAFNVQPRITGQILIGSSRQFADTSPAINFALLGKMIARAAEYMPRIADLSIIRTWTGFRAATTDKLPLIGPVPNQDGLFLATGHEGLGITTSLGTARLLADAILGRPTEIPIEPYLPSRPNAEAHHA